ncbi:hypothetical protein A2U01_0067451, partial [Trifolium medium]|nr:hypothetical protein [Trifolium medium]
MLSIAANGRNSHRGEDSRDVAEQSSVAAAN